MVASGTGTKEQPTWRRPGGAGGGGGEEAVGEDGEKGCLAPPTSSSHPGGGGGGLERLHLVLFRTMQRSEGGFWSAGC